MGRPQPAEKHTIDPTPSTTLQEEIDSEFASDPPLGLPSYQESLTDDITDAVWEGRGQGVEYGVEQPNGAAGQWNPAVEKQALKRYAEEAEWAELEGAKEGTDQDTPRPPSYDVSVAGGSSKPTGFRTGPSTGSGISPAPPSKPQLYWSLRRLPPTDLVKVDLGSKYIAHSPAPITCTLALPGDIHLLGTTQGLKVFLPGEENPARSIWTGLAVWQMAVLRQDDVRDGPAPRGSVLLFCGGVEEGSTGRPKKDGEARVWKLQTLLNLARWAAGQEDYAGLDLAPKKSKGKGVASSFRSLSLGGSKESAPKASSSSSRRYPPEPAGLEKASLWAADYMCLPFGAQAVLAVATHITPDTIQIALVTPACVILHSGKILPSGSSSFAPPRTFWVPFAPTAVSLVELEVPGSPARATDDCSSSVFEWDDDPSAISLGESVVGSLLGLYVTFQGGRGCVIRASDMGIVELKKGGRGEWLPVEKVTVDHGEVYVFTRGTSSFLFSAPLTVPLAMQVPLAEITWPEMPASIRAMPGPTLGIRLLGLTAAGNLHVIDVTPGERGMETDWTSVGGALGEGARFLSEIKSGQVLPTAGSELKDGSGIGVGTCRAPGDWRVAYLLHATRHSPSPLQQNNIESFPFPGAP